MGLFDPKVDANITPTQQVSAGPSGLQVLGSVLGGAIGRIRRRHEGSS